MPEHGKMEMLLLWPDPNMTVTVLKDLKIYVNIVLTIPVILLFDGKTRKGSEYFK